MRRGTVPIAVVYLIIGLLVLGAGVLYYLSREAKKGPPAPIGGGGDACGGCPRGYECTQECGPPVVRQDEPPPGWSCSPAGKPRMCPICLASATNIATPNGAVNVKELRAGMLVWSQDGNGEKIASRVIRVSRAAAPTSHRVAHLVLEDGRAVRVSPDHPTANGRRVADLRPGESYDGSIVRASELVPYGDAFTYDLLPDSETGTYWADGILFGSTLRR